MNNNTKKWISIVFGVCSAIFTAVYVAFLLINFEKVPALGVELTDGLISSITLSFLGFLLSYRRPGNRISWLLVLIALLRQTSYLFNIANIINLEEIESIVWPVIGNIWPSLSGLTYTLLAYVIIMFPNGRLPSPRWHLATFLLGLQAALSVGLLLTVNYDLAQSIHDIRELGAEVKLVPVVPSGPGTLMRNVQEMPELGNYFLVIAVMALIIILLGLLSQISQYRTGTKIVRQQIKWVMFVVALWAISIVLVILPLNIPFTAMIIISPLIPISISVAILRYRLYEIDLIIRRTAVYAIITGLLAVIYFGSVTLIQNLVAVVSGQESPIAIVISTLIIAALFTPLRQRVQGFIDRRFYRKKYDSGRTLSDFADTARDEVNLDALAAELTTTIRKTLQPASVSLWLNPKQEHDR